MLYYQDKMKNRGARGRVHLSWSCDGRELQVTRQRSPSSGLAMGYIYIYIYIGTAEFTFLSPGDGRGVAEFICLLLEMLQSCQLGIALLVFPGDGRICFLWIPFCTEAFIPVSKRRLHFQA